AGLVYKTHAERLPVRHVAQSFMPQSSIASYIGDSRDEKWTPKAGLVYKTHAERLPVRHVAQSFMPQSSIASYIG
ncbi:hypothetical protein CK247_30755, partial [Klebsiella pneumoniae]